MVTPCLRTKKNHLIHTNLMENINPYNYKMITKVRFSKHLQKG